MEETFKLVKERFDKLSFSKPLDIGIVLKCDGSELFGTVDMAAQISNLQVLMGILLSVCGFVED